MNGKSKLLGNGCWCWRYQWPVPLLVSFEISVTCSSSGFLPEEEQVTDISSLPKFGCHRKPHRKPKKHTRTLSFVNCPLASTIAGCYLSTALSPPPLLRRTQGGIESVRALAQFLLCPSQSWLFWSSDQQKAAILFRHTSGARGQDRQRFVSLSVFWQL